MEHVIHKAEAPAEHGQAGICGRGDRFQVPEGRGVALRTNGPPRKRGRQQCMFRIPLPHMVARERDAGRFRRIPAALFPPYAVNAVSRRLFY